MLIPPTTSSATGKSIPLIMPPLHIIVYDSGKISILVLVLPRTETMAAVLVDLPHTTMMFVYLLQDEGDDGCDPPQTKMRVTLWLVDGGGRCRCPMVVVLN
ncbi:unnamed protein product [Lactuca virosa]|uniref:Uncharacterized protein n=1 Tax=Lactuca virosa TaxID=75947 RepID=A0AAU9MGD7_9ASTR|nr:unnamed protein product [Lactuca virosa]